MTARVLLALLACAVVSFALAFVVASHMPTYEPYTEEPYTEGDAFRDLDRQVYGHPTRSYSWLDDGVVTGHELDRVRSGNLR